MLLLPVPGAVNFDNGSVKKLVKSNLGLYPSVSFVSLVSTICLLYLDANGFRNSDVTVDKCGKIFVQNSKSVISHQS